MIRHHPFYCEENVWWLAQEPALIDGSVLVITNARRRVIMDHQRAGRGIAWDYHVVLRDGDRIWDHEHDLGMPVGARAWLDASFPIGVPPIYRPLFRVVPAREYVARFCSDRSHMRAGGRWLEPPPPWPCIGEGPPTLARFLDLTDPIAGTVVALEELRCALIAP